LSYFRHELELEERTMADALSTSRISQQKCDRVATQAKKFDALALMIEPLKFQRRARSSVHEVAISSLVRSED
jgi:hypothetical protein